MVSQLQQTLRVVCPLAASACILTTLVTCVVIVKVKHIWVGGLVWPFFSDMGRDPPAYYVFCTGLSLVGVLLLITWFLNHSFLMQELRPAQSKALLYAAYFTTFAGMIATPGIPTLAFFDTSTYTAIHANAASWFFYWEACAMLVNTFLTYKIYKLSLQRANVVVDLESGASARQVSESTRKRKKTLTIQVVFFSCFFVAFLLYMPIGMALPGTAPRLTISECLAKDLGETYCTVTMKLNDTQTKLFNSRKTFTKSQLRACGQLGCILMLVGYASSFATNDYNAGADDAASRINSTAPTYNTDSATSRTATSSTTKTKTSTTKKTKKKQQSTDDTAMAATA